MIGFIYRFIRKAFLPKKTINFKATSTEKRNTIAAVSGDPDAYTPFSVSETELFSNPLHLADCTTLNKKTSSVPVGKFLKDNKKIFDCNVRLALLNCSGKPEKFSIDLVLNIENFFKFSQKKIGE